MKTPEPTFLNLTTQQPCVKTDFGSLRSWLLLPSLFSLLRAKKSQWLQAFVHASQAIHATLRVSLQEVSSNNRLLAALFFMLVVAPFTGGLYKLFDPHEVLAGVWYTPNEYFGNFRYLLMGIRGNLLSFFTILGTFFLFPSKYKTSYLLCAPLGYILADSIHKISATSNEEFNAMTSIPHMIMCVALVLGFLLSVDYLLYRHHHIKRKWWAHIVGIIRTPGIPAEDKIKYLEGEIRSVEQNYYSIY